MGGHVRIKKCRNCKTAIPADARICPYCLKRQWRAVIIVLFVFFIGIIIAGGYIKMTDKGQIEFDAFSPGEESLDNRAVSEIGSVEYTPESEKTSESEEEKRQLEIEKQKEERIGKKRIEQRRLEIENKVLESAEKEEREKERMMENSGAREKRERESVKRKIEERERALREQVEKASEGNGWQDETSREGSSPDPGKRVESPDSMDGGTVSEGIPNEVNVPLNEPVTEGSEEIELQDKSDAKE